MLIDKLINTQVRGLQSFKLTGGRLEETSEEAIFRAKLTA